MMPDGKSNPFCLQNVQHLLKALKLEPGIADIIRLPAVCHREVCEHPFQNQVLQLGKRLDVLYRLWMIIGKEPQTRHSGIKL